MTEFRKMRRFRQELPKETVEAILTENTHGVLALSGDDDWPYAVPISYVYADGKLIFHGAKAGHKFDAMRKEPRVSFCVVDEDNVIPEEYTTYFRSVIAFGKVRIPETEEETRYYLDLLAARYRPDFIEERNAAIDRELKLTAMFVMDIEHLTGKEAIEYVKAREKGGDTGRR